jgi:hypothetical protein
MVTDDAGWNAFDGHWGTAVCVAKVYCARSNAPQSPGKQERYKRPWCYDFAVDTDLRHPRVVRPTPPACAKQPKRTNDHPAQSLLSGPARR